MYIYGGVLGHQFTCFTIKKKQKYLRTSPPQTRREHPLTVCVGAFFYFFLSPSLALEVRVARLRRYSFYLLYCCKSNAFF